LWQKIRGIFKKSSPVAPEEVVAPPAEPAPTVDEKAEEYNLDHFRNLLAAVLMEKQGGDTHEIIDRLRKVADSQSALSETRAFALVGIGELYVRMETPEPEKAREVFCELIDSESKEEAWRLRALVFRAGIDSDSEDASLLNSALRDVERVVQSPLVEAIEESYVCRAYCVRGVASRNLGNFSQALSDFQRVIDTPSYDAELRIAAFTFKVNLLASQGRWMDEAEACLDAIRSTGDADIVEIAMDRFSNLWDEREDWDSAVAALNAFEKRDGMTERERYCILNSRLKAYIYRAEEGDVRRQIDDLTSLIEKCELSGHEFATKVMGRFSLLSLHGDDVSGDQHIDDFERLLKTPGAATHQYGGADCVLGRLYAAKNTEEDLNKAVHHWSRALRSPQLWDADRVVALMDRAKIYIAFELFDAAISDYSEVIEMGDRAPDEMITMVQELRSAAQAMQRSSADFEVVDRVGALSDAEVEEAIDLARHHAYSPIGNGPREGLRILRGLIENPQISTSARARALAQRAFFYAALPEVRDLRQTIRDTTAILEIPGLADNDVALALINRASAYVERRSPGDIENAIADFRRCAALEEADRKHIAAAIVNLGNLCVSVGDNLGALEHFGRVADLLPGFEPLALQARLFRGNYFLGISEFQRALPEFDAMLNAEHDEVGARRAALYGRACVFSALRDYAAAAEDLSAGLELPDLSPEDACMFASQRGVALLRTRTPEALILASKDFEFVLGSEGGALRWRAAAYFGQGLICYREGNAEKAVGFFTEALSYDELEGSYRIACWANRAETLQVLDDPAYSEMELSDYDELIEIGEYLDEQVLSFALESRARRFPHLTAPDFNLRLTSEGLEFADRKEAAEAYYERAIAILNGEAEGGEREMLSNFDAALGYPELSAEHRAVAHFNRGQGLANFNGACEDILRDMTACIENPEAWPNLRSQALLKRAELFEEIDMALAMTDYESVISGSDISEEIRLEALNNRARLLLPLGDFDGVFRDCSLILNHAESTMYLLANASFLRGQAFLNMDRFPEALADFKAAKSTPEASANVKTHSHFYLAVIHMQLGTPTDLLAAKRELELALASPALDDRFRVMAERMLGNLGP